MMITEGLTAMGWLCLQGCTAWRISQEPASCKRCSPFSAKARSNQCSFSTSQAKPEKRSHLVLLGEPRWGRKLGTDWPEVSNVIESQSLLPLYLGAILWPHDQLHLLSKSKAHNFVHFFILVFCPCFPVHKCPWEMGDSSKPTQQVSL